MSIEDSIPFIIAVLFTSFLVWVVVGEYRRSLRLTARSKARAVEAQAIEDRINAAKDLRIKEAEAKVAEAESELRINEMVVKHFEDKEAYIRRQLAELDAKS